MRWLLLAVALLAVALLAPGLASAGYTLPSNAGGGSTPASCSADGEYIEWNGTAFVCSTHNDGTLAAIGQNQIPCAAGEEMRVELDGTGWECIGPTYAALKDDANILFDVNFESSDCDEDASLWPADADTGGTGTTFVTAAGSPKATTPPGNYTGNVWMECESANTCGCIYDDNGSPDPDDLQNKTALTFAARFYVFEDAVNETLGAGKILTRANCFGLHVNRTVDEVVFSVNGTTGGESTIYARENNTPRNLPALQWHSLVASWCDDDLAGCEADETTKIWINGRQIETDDQLVDDDVIAGFDSCAANFGVLGTGSGVSTLRGAIDEAGIWDRVFDTEDAINYHCHGLGYGFNVDDAICR